MSGDDFSHGLVHVYTGDGKGKTTAALGLALRAAGYGFRSSFIQFLKGVPYGEQSALADCQYITLRQFGTADWLHPDHIRDEDRSRAGQALEHAQQVVAGRAHQLVVLDEVNVALAWGLVPVEAVLALIRSRPTDIELVLTGRWAPAEIVAAADLVTEMHEIKHPYQQGIMARRGIEF